MNDPREIAMTIWLTKAEYRALMPIAAAKKAQAHQLVEALVNRSLGGVRAPSGRVKVPRKPPEWVPDEIALRVKEMHASGMPEMQMAALLGVSRNVVKNRRQRLNLPAPKRGRPAQLSKERAA